MITTQIFWAAVPSYFTWIVESFCAESREYSHSSGTYLLNSYNLREKELFNFSGECFESKKPSCF